MGNIYEKCAPPKNSEEFSTGKSKRKREGEPGVQSDLQSPVSDLDTPVRKTRTQSQELETEKFAQLEKSFMKAGIMDQNDNDVIRNRDSYFSREEIEEYERKFKINDGGGSVTIPEAPVKIKWKEGEMLGFGSFGRVVSGLNLNTGELMAVKQVVLKGFNVSTEKINALQIEIELLKQLKHKNIVRYIGSSQGKDVLNIFLEYVAGGSIASLLNRYGPFKEKLIRVYTKQILEGLEYLHANRLIHRDIKGANVLITTDAICKLADFGSAKKIVGMNETEKYQSLRGTAYWMAPEVIRQSGHGRHADIWSVGCTVLEMATGKPPWSEIDNQIAAMFHIAQTESLPAIPAHLSPEAKDFLKCCFRRNPLERPNVCKLLKHPFIVGDVARSVPRELRLPVGNADLQFNSVNSLNSAGSSKGNGKAYNTMNAEFKSGNSTKPSEDEKEFRSAPTNHSKLLGQLASSPELLQFQSSNGISPVFAPQPIPYQPQSATLAHKSKDIPTRPVEVKSRYARDPKASIDPKRSVKDVDLLFGEEKGLNSTQFEVLNEVFSKLKEADQPKGQNDPMSELMSPNIKADADRFAGRGVEAGPEQNGMKQSNISENKIDFQNYYYSNKNYFPDPV